MEQARSGSVGENLQKLIRFASTDRLRSITNRHDIVVEDLSSASERLTVHAYWMSFVLLAGEGGTLTFKTHYTSRDIQELAAITLKKDPSKIQSGMIADFMREYCNLTVGLVKVKLAEVGIHTGLSIPVVTRGFDEIWYRDYDLEDTFRTMDAWRIKWGSGSIVCSMSAHAEEWTQAQYLKDPASESGAGGEMEFL